MNWTEQQERAITLRGKNILVAAAAGSGKTAVLVERIKQLILKDGVDIDRMLIVTFTNAAAAEMKEKIEAAIQKEIEDNPAAAGKLKHQLELLPMANISTFHAFCLEVIRRYFYLIDIDPSFKICDNVQQELLLEEALDELLKEYFEENSPEFIDFLNKYSGDRNESRLRDTIRKTYSVLRSLPEPFAWLDGAVEELGASLEEFKNGPVYTYIINDTRERLATAARSIEELAMNFLAAEGVVPSLLGEDEQTSCGGGSESEQDVESESEAKEEKTISDFLAAALEAANEKDEEEAPAEPKVHAGLCEIISMHMNLANELMAAADTGDFERIRTKINTSSAPRFSKKYFKEDETHSQLEVDEWKEKLDSARKPLKDAIKFLGENYYYDELSVLHAEVRSTEQDGKFFRQMLQRFDELFGAAKARRGVVDFGDIEHMAYQILGNEEAATHYREKFSYIFIDEYQDSNVLQEALVDKIKRANNLFMVGDVKQSIYKFRLAEPEIFQKKYADYARQMQAAGGVEASGEEGEAGAQPESTQNAEPAQACGKLETCGLSEKIDLNANFRSKRSVIGFINRIFRRLMGDYDENAALHLGDPHGDECNHTPKLFLAQSTWEDDEQLDDELKNLVKAEKEALCAVKLIKESLGKTIFDSKKNVKRPLEKRDIVILMRSIKNYGDVFYKIFTDNNLPAYVDDNEGYFDTMEINIFMSLLEIIDNEKQDIPLITALRSEIFGFSIAELSEIRIASYNMPTTTTQHRNKLCSYHDALTYYANSGEDALLREKSQSVLDKLAGWRTKAQSLPLEELIWELMLETGFYIAMGAMPAGTQRQANLRALCDKALNYRKSQGGTLYGFIQYIELVKKHKVTMGQAKLLAQGEDTIRIMTIHKSKGLEFPMVLLAGFCRRLNYTRAGKGIVVHKDLGLGLPIVHPEESWYRRSIIQNVIKAKEHQEEVEEEKRVLYVALTRAKDILYILGMVDDVDEEINKLMKDGAGDGSYFSMCGLGIYSLPASRGRIEDSELANISQGQRRNTTKVLELLDAEADVNAVRTQNNGGTEAAADAGTGKAQSQANPELAAEIARRLEFTYPHEDELHIKSKYSVSELNSQAIAEKFEKFAKKQAVQQEITLAEPQSFKLKKKLTAAEIGTITHKVLEKLDFVEASKSQEEYLEKLLSELVADEFLTEDEAKAVELDKIASLVNSPLGRRMTDAQAKDPHALQREKPFTLKLDKDGKELVAQGTIDCFFEEGGELVLIDYKTTNVTSQAELAKRKAAIKANYQTQIELYKEALQAATGKPVKEAYLYLTNIGAAIDM